MKVLLIRHGEAGEPNRGQDDLLRPLTTEGITQFARHARALRALLPTLDAIYTSPLTRAQQTAEILATCYGGPAAVVMETLAPPHSPQALLATMQQRHPNPVELIALVGHEPNLGLFGTWLLAGATHRCLPLKKGGACLIQCKEGWSVGHSTLEWLMSPDILRRLAA